MYFFTIHASNEYCRNNRLTTTKYSNRKLQQSTVINLRREQIPGGKGWELWTKLPGNLILLLLDSSLPILSDVANSTVRNLTTHVQIYNLECKLFLYATHPYFWKENLGKKCIIPEKILEHVYVVTFCACIPLSVHDTNWVPKVYTVLCTELGMRGVFVKLFHHFSFPEGGLRLL